MEFLSMSRYGASDGGEDGAGLSARNHCYRNIGYIQTHTRVVSIFQALPMNQGLEVLYKGKDARQGFKLRF